MRRRVLFYGALFAQLLAGASALGQAPSSPAPSHAEQLFQQGRTAADAGDYKTACERFAESERLEPAPGTLLNIADCEEHMGRLVSAREHFDLAASGYRRDDGRREYAAGRANALEKRLAHLTLHLAPGVGADAAITKGGQSLDRATLDKTMPADPGTVAIVVAAPGRERRVYTLDLKEGGSAEATLNVGDPLPVPSAGGGHAGEADAKRSGWRTVGFVAAGVGLAGIATGAVTGVLALGDASTVKSHCNASYACDQQGVDAASSGKTFTLISTVSLAAGAVLVAAGAYLILSTGGKHASDERAAHATLLLAPYAMPHAGGAAMALTF